LLETKGIMKCYKIPPFPLFKGEIISILLIFIAFTLSAEGATLNINVKDVNGNPASGVVFQIFSENPDIDANIPPIQIGNPPASDKRDNDGDGQIDEVGENIVGYATGADGKLQLDLPVGSYTIVGFSQLKHYVFVRQVSVPDSVVINAVDTVPVTISCLAKDGTPISTPEVFFRPTKRVKASVGYGDKNGQIKAYISEGEYNIVLRSATGQGQHYLVLPHYVISKPEAKVSLNVSEIPTATLNFVLSKTTALAIFEILDSTYTSEYTEGVEPEVGYDAAYTDFYPFISAEQPFTVSANVDYNFSMSLGVTFGKGTIYAYEIRPYLHQVTPGVHPVGITENDKFSLRIGSDHGDKDPVYHQGEKVGLLYRFIDNQGNTLSRILNITGARLLYPLVTIRDPNNTPIANNFNSPDFSGFEFTLSKSAVTGEYRAEISLDAGLYGNITDTFRFYVQPVADNESPVIDSVDIPDQIEAGVELKVTANVSDNSGSISGKPLIRISKDSGISWTEIQMSLSQEDLYTVSVPSNMITIGNLSWQITAQDTSGNNGIRSGTTRVVDTRPPVITHKVISKAELGVKLTLEADVSDNVEVKEVNLLYILPDGTNKSVKMSKTVLVPPSNGRAEVTYSASIDGSEITLDGLNYYISAVDISGNVAFVPSEADSPKFAHISVEDTTPPIISHTSVQIVKTDAPVNIEAIITDNSGVVDATLFYKNNLDQDYQSVKMNKQAGIFVGEIPSSAVFVPPSNGRTDVIGIIKYHILAKDANFSSTSPVTGDYTIKVVSISQEVIASLDITPSASQDNPLKVKVGESLKFSVIGRTEANDPMPVDVIWLTTDGIGHIDQDGSFLSSGCIIGNGKGKVIAVAVNVTPIMAETWVQLVSDTPALIALNPGSIIIPAGNQHRFFATAKDLYSNPVESDIKWSLDSKDNIGTMEIIGQSVVIQLTKAGKGKLIAESGGLNAVSDITVVPGDLKRIVIDTTNKTKAPFVVPAGTNLQFTATGFDTYNNAILVPPSNGRTDLVPPSSGRTENIIPVWSVCGNIGSIRSDGIFTGGIVGNGQIVATLNDVSSTVDVEVITGNLYTISVSPYTAYLPISTDKYQSRHQFMAIGKDIAGNPVRMKSVSWSTDAMAGTISASGLFTATIDTGVRIGEVVANGTIYANGVSVSGNSANGTGYVVVQKSTPNRLTSIKVLVQGTSGSIPDVNITAGDSVQFEAVGSDSESRSISINALWSVSGGIGNMDVNGLFTATKPGSGTVIATSGGFSSQIEINVTPGSLKSIKIKPEIMFLNPGMKSLVSVVGYDSYENVVPLDDVQWSVSGSSVLIETKGNSCSMEVDLKPKENINTISAKYGDLVAFTNVFVSVSSAEIVNNSTVEQANLVPPSNGRTKTIPYYLEITPDLISVITGTKHQFTARAIDVLGNEISTGTLTWIVTSGIGEIDGSGLFSATNDLHTGRIIVTDGKVFGSAFVTVSPVMIKPSDLIVIPSKVAVLAGETQKCIALIKSFNNKGVIYVPSAGVPAWRVIGNNGIVDSSGRFTATIVGDGTIEASIAGLSSKCEVTTSIGTLTNIEIQPGTFSIKSGEQQKLRIVSKDSVGNTEIIDPAFLVPPSNGRTDLVPPSNGRTEYSFLILNKIGVIDQSGVFSAQKAGAGYVLVSKSGSALLGKADIQVIPDNIESIEIIPDNQKMASGSFIRFSAIGMDASDNLIPINPIWETSEIGTISTDGLFIADKVGNGKVIARLGDKLAFVSVEVIAGIPSFVIVEPSLISISSQSTEKRQFNAVFKDMRGNVVSNLSDVKILWSVTEELGIIDTTGVFINRNLDEPRTGYVNVTVIFNQGTAKERTIYGNAIIVLQPVPKPLASITITPNPVSVIKGDVQRFSVTGKNSDGLEMEVKPQWRVVGSDETEIKGAISADGVFSSTVLVPPSNGRTDDMKVGSNWKVIASSSNSDGKVIQGETAVSIIAGPLQSIEIACKECNEPIESGKIIDLTATGYDKFQNAILVPPSNGRTDLVPPSNGRTDDVLPNWKVVGQIGTITGSKNSVLPLLGGTRKAVFIAGLAGSGEVVAELSGIEGKVHITVIHGQLSGIRIFTEHSDESIGSTILVPPSNGSTEENPLIIKSGSNINFKSVGYDSDTDELGRLKPVNTINISPEWSLKGTNLGSVSVDGNFIARESGNGSIEAKVGSVTSSFYFKVIHGDLATIKISPSSISLTSGKDKEQKFAASGYDQYGNQIPDIQPAWKIIGGIGNIDGNGVLTTVVLPIGTNAISGTVIASQNGIEGSATVTVVTVLGELSKLVITIEPSIVSAGGKAICAVKGFDESGNPIGKLPDTIRLSILPLLGGTRDVSSKLGSLTPSDTPNTWTFRAIERLSPDPNERKGVLNVTADSNGKVLSASASFSLIPAPLDRIIIDPANTSISAGEDLSFIAYGYDAYNNVLELSDPKWTVLGNIGKVNTESQQECVFSAINAGNGQLIISSQGHEGKSEIKVIAGKIETLTIQPEFLVIESGASLKFTVIAKDHYGNAIADPELSWQVIGDIGTINDGTFSATKAGKGSIRVTYNKLIFVESNITVIPGAIASADIIIEYNGANLNPPYNLISGNQYSLYLHGFDSHGNEISQLKEVSWKITEDKGVIIPSQDKTTLTTLFIGSGEVSAIIGKVSVSSSINVIPYTQKVNSNKGLIIQGPFDAEIDISPRAFRNDETISVSLYQSSGAVQNTKRIGYVYKFEPEGVILSIPAKLTLSYKYVSTAVDDTKLSIYFWNKFQKKWIRAGGYVDSVQKTVTVNVNFLSQFTIMQEETEIEIKNSNHLDVRLTPNTYFAPEVNRLTINYNIGWKNREVVNVTISIYDIRGSLVRELVNKIPKLPSWNSEQWDGTDESGKIVKNGRYFVVITVETDSDKISKTSHLAIFR